MSNIVSRMAAAKLAARLALAVAALILMCFLDARIEGGMGLGATQRFDVPSGAPWCGPVDGRGTKSCRYLSFEHCLAAANADYRSCKPNPTAVATPDDTPYWTYRSVFSARDRESVL